MDKYKISVITEKNIKSLFYSEKIMFALCFQLITQYKQKIFGVADFMYENDFFYAETPVPDVKFHVWNIQIHTSIQQRQIFCGFAD